MSSKAQARVVESWTEQNIQVIEGGIAVLEATDASRYAARHESFGASSVGEHVRHTIEFYECLLAGLASGRVDYDARKRDTRLEHDRAHALERWREMAARLRELPSAVVAGQAHHALQVKLDRPEVGVPAQDASPATLLAWSSSSIERELQFLASHTVHHFTVIALLLRLDGVEVDADFGVAPSTLHHRRTSGATH